MQKKIRTGKNQKRRTRLTAFVANRCRHGGLAIDHSLQGGRGARRGSIAGVGVAPPHTGWLPLGHAPRRMRSGVPRRAISAQAAEARVPRRRS